MLEEKARPTRRCSDVRLRLHDARPTAASPFAAINCNAPKALAALRAKTSGPIFLIGKYMGGWIGCHVSLEEKVSGVIWLGYPLCANRQAHSNND